jgi:acetate kinase
VEHCLNLESGLLGVSGVSGDLRALLENREPAAQLAVDLFVHRIVMETGAMVAALAV